MTALDCEIQKRELAIDEVTARDCLFAVQSYLNSRHVKLVQKQCENGEVELRYEPY